MSEKPNPDEPGTEEKKVNRPSYTAYHVKDGPDDKSYFNRVGAALAHKDGEGHTLELDAIPVNGRIVLRTPKDRLNDLKDEKTGKGASRDHDDRER